MKRMYFKISEVFNNLYTDDHVVINDKEYIYRDRLTTWSNSGSVDLYIFENVLNGNWKVLKKDDKIIRL